MPRLRFALFFTQNPPAVDVIREDAFVEIPGEKIAAGQTRTLRNTTCSGEILKVGTRTLMTALRVTKDGEVHTTANDGVQYVESRKKEQAKLVKEGTRESYLHSVAVNLATKGMNSLEVQRGQQRTLQKRRQLKRPPQDLDELKTELENLECFRESDGDVELTKGSKIYINSTKLLYITDMFKSKPERLFKTLMTVCLTEKVASMPGLSATGTRCTVQVPQQIVQSVYAYVKLTSTAEFHAVSTRLVKHFLSYACKEKKELLSFESSSGSSGNSSCSSSFSIDGPIETEQHSSQNQATISQLSDPLPVQNSSANPQQQDHLSSLQMENNNSTYSLDGGFPSGNAWSANTELQQLSSDYADHHDVPGAIGQLMRL